MSILDLFKDKNKEYAIAWHANPICVCGNRMTRASLQEKHGRAWIDKGEYSFVKYFCKNCGGITEGPHYDGYGECWMGINRPVRNWIDSVMWFNKRTRIVSESGKVLAVGKD